MKYLRFGKVSAFNHPVDNLPISLVELRLGNPFNQSLDNLPRNLYWLTIPCTYSLPTRIQKKGEAEKKKRDSGKREERR